MVDFGPSLCLSLTVGPKSCTGVTCARPDALLPSSMHTLGSIWMILHTLGADYDVIWSHITGNINCISKAFYIDMKIL